MGNLTYKQILRCSSDATMDLGEKCMEEYWSITKTRWEPLSIGFKCGVNADISGSKVSIYPILY